MPGPVKALHEGQYTIPSLAKGVGSHDVARITFIDADGEQKTGWLKKFDDTYPEFLANFAVALSTQMRIPVERVSEDRLCFDKEGKAIGTVSVSLPNFKEMLCLLESVDDPNEEALRNPSVETLLHYNVAELLVASALSKDNDAHPGNFSIHGIIDRDEGKYRLLTMIIKGARWVNIEGLFSWLPPSQVLTFTGSTISDFPYLPGRTFTPTAFFPSNTNMGKTCKAYQAFRDLAKNPSIETAEGIVSFQDQVFYALLKELITFDPELLRARLTEYLGDRPLGFLALGDDKSKALAQAYPKLFKLPIPAQKGRDGEPDIPEQPSNNDERFVDVMVRFFQDEYDEAYRAIVHYIGCSANIADAPVMSFSEYLQKKPFDFEKICQEARAKNELMQQRWQAHVDRVTNNDAKVSNPLDAYCSPVACYYDIEKMQIRYYQVWRDAYILMFSGIMLKAKTLSLHLQDALSLNKPNLSTSPARPGIQDPTYTCASQFMRKPSFREPVELDCDDANPIGNGLHLLNEFTYKLEECTADYYLPCHTKSMDENIAVNKAFCENLKRLFSDYYQPICDKLKSSIWATDFAQIYFELTQYSKCLTFVYHPSQKQANSSNQDESLSSVNLSHDYSSILSLNASNAKVIATGINALFNWAKQADKKAFNEIILSVIDSYEAGNLLGYRRRGDNVRQYLKSQLMLGPKAPSCDKLLAYIFHSGETYSTSLNTLLINKLLPIVLGEVPIDLHLKVIALAIEQPGRVFDPTLYSAAAQQYVHKANYFDSPYEQYRVDYFNQILYDAVAKIEPQKFRNKIKSVLNEYTNQRSFLASWGGFFKGKPGREAEIEGYFAKSFDNQSILAAIFSYDDGGCKETSFNTRLFSSLITILEMSFSASKIKNDKKQWVLDIHLSQNPELRMHYLLAQKQYALDFLAEKKAESTLSIESISSSSSALS